MLAVALEMWQKAFYDHSYQVVSSATYQYILQNKFPPTIAEIREEVIKITNPDALKTGEQAWEEVVKAVKRFGYYRQGEALKTLDKATQRAVNTVGWQDICHSEKIGVVRSNFFKVFEAVNKGAKEEAILPSGLYEQIKKLSQQEATNEQIKLQKL